MKLLPAALLGVQSRHVVEGIESESLRLFCPELTDALEGRETAKTLESLRKVVRLEKGGQVGAETVVRLVVEPPDRSVFDGTVHPFDLAIGPRVVEFREAMLDSVLRTGQVERMGTKRLMIRQQLLNLFNAPATMRRGEVEAVIGEHRMNPIGDMLDQPAKKLRRDASSRPFV